MISAASLNRIKLMLKGSSASGPRPDIFPAEHFDRDGIRMTIMIERRRTARPGTRRKLSPSEFYGSSFTVSAGGTTCRSRKFRPRGLGNMRGNRGILHRDVCTASPALCSCLRPVQGAAPARDREPVFAPSAQYRVAEGSSDPQKRSIPGPLDHGAPDLQLIGKA